jgi:hypothetical protein
METSVPLSGMGLSFFHAYLAMALRKEVLLLSPFVVHHHDTFCNTSGNPRMLWNTPTTNLLRFAQIAEPSEVVA